MTHYRKLMSYKPQSLVQAAEALESLRRAVGSLKGESQEIDQKYKKQFSQAINDDLNMPQAIAVLQSLLKAKLPEELKKATVAEFDKVLGLNLIPDVLPSDIKNLLDNRDNARATKNWAESDRLREEIEKRGYMVEDGPNGTNVLKK